MWRRVSVYNGSPGMVPTENRSMRRRQRPVEICSHLRVQKVTFFGSAKR